jgi:hypothetical protein
MTIHAKMYDAYTQLLKFSQPLPLHLANTLEKVTLQR